jgi:hypothetical protein
MSFFVRVGWSRRNLVMSAERVPVVMMVMVNVLMVMVVVAVVLLRVVLV